MIAKTKKNDIAPWQTYQEKSLTSDFNSSAIKVQSQQNNHQQIKLTNIKLKTIEKKNLSTIDYLLKLKKSSQITKYQHFSQQKKQQPQKVSQLIPLNSNIISIINKTHEKNTNLNPQTTKQRQNMKKIQKISIKNVKNEKNKYSIESKVTLDKKKQEIQHLKHSLLYKLHPSLDTLLIAKNKLTRISSIHQKPILRSYSIHTIRLNTVEQKDIQGINSKNSEKSIFTKTTHQKFRPKSDLRDQIIKKNTSNRVNRKQSNHIIDRLFDRFQ